MSRGPWGNREANMAALAEAVSKHGSVRQGASDIGLSLGYCRNLWAQIVRDFGWQAR